MLLSMTGQLHKNRLQGSFLPGKSVYRQAGLDQSLQKLCLLGCPAVKIDHNVVALDRHGTHPALVP